MVLSSDIFINRITTINSCDDTYIYNTCFHIGSSNDTRMKQHWNRPCHYWNRITVLHTLSIYNTFSRESSDLRSEIEMPSGVVRCVDAGAAVFLEDRLDAYED